MGGVTFTTVPMVDQLAGYVEHGAVVRAHRSLAERRCQEIVRLAPVGFVVVRREQAVAADSAECFDSRCKVLREPGLVGQFCHHVRARGEDEAISQDISLEDRAEFAADAHGVLQRCPDIDPENVPEDRQAPRRMRDPSIGRRLWSGVDAHFVSPGVRSLTELMSSTQSTPY